MATEKDDRPRYADEIATGAIRRKLRIAGRPREGAYEDYVLLEEPGEPVLMHFSGRLVPHYKRGCPNCKPDQEEPKPMWYVGARNHAKEPVILELTDRCWESLEAFAREKSQTIGVDLYGQPIAVDALFIGLLVRIQRANFKNSPRTLRGLQRVPVVKDPWPWRTREELARIWGVPIRPRLFRAEGG
jgi:hypothetical protein